MGLKYILKEKLNDKYSELVYLIIMTVSVAIPLLIVKAMDAIEGIKNTDWYENLQTMVNYENSQKLEKIQSVQMMITMYGIVAIVIIGFIVVLISNMYLKKLKDFSEVLKKLGYTRSKILGYKTKHLVITLLFSIALAAIVYVVAGQTVVDAVGINDFVTGNK